MSVAKIISGGQTGADIAARSAAARLGIPTGGFAAKHFTTELGPDPTLGTKYGLVEMGPSTDPLARSYTRRSMANVDAADVTIAIYLGYSVGTAKTVGCALTGHWAEAPLPRSATTSDVATAHRPLLLIHTLNPARSAEVVAGTKAFLNKYHPSIVNVCGPRAWSAVPEFGSVVEELLVKVFDS